MEPTRAASALAAASAALVAPHDIPGFLVNLLRSCQDVLDVDACGVLLQHEGHLELLAASDHEAEHLELYQVHHGEGPCVEASQSDSAVGAQGEELATRWPIFGPVMRDAGYQAVQASPLAWNGRAIGALGMFRRSNESFDPEAASIAQAFANISTLLIAQSESWVLGDHISRALTSRVVVEQAKGVLAELESVDMATAFQLMTDRAEHDGVTLTDFATQVISGAAKGEKQDLPLDL